MARRMLQLLVALMVAASPLVLSIDPARADNASVLLGLVNALRASHGVGPLYADPALAGVAQRWSAHMASGYGLSHNPDVGFQVAGGWTKLGENVGEGGSIYGIYNAFVSSSFHLGNMLDPTYNLTGIGVAVGRLNTLWVTQDFEAKPGATPATTAPPATAAPPTTARPATNAPPTTKQAALPPATTPPVAPSSAATPPSPATPAPPTSPGGTGDPGAPVSDLTPSAPRPPESSVPGKLAAAASTTGHAPGGGSLSGLAVTLATLGVVVLSAAAFFVRLLVRSP